MGIKHSPCRLHQYEERLRTQIYSLRQHSILIGRFHFEPLPHDHLRFTGRALCIYGLKVEVDEILLLLTRKGRDSLVRRESYRYHAFLSGHGNVRRYEGPDLNPHPRAPEYHREHHRHLYHPLTLEETVEILNENETPTAPEFIREMLNWVSENAHLLEPLTMKRIAAIDLL